MSESLPVTTETKPPESSDVPDAPGDPNFPPHPDSRSADSYSDSRSADSDSRSADSADPDPNFYDLGHPSSDERADPDGDPDGDEGTGLRKWLSKLRGTPGASSHDKDSSRVPPDTSTGARGWPFRIHRRRATSDLPGRGGPDAGGKHRESLTGTLLIDDEDSSRVPPDTSTGARGWPFRIRRGGEGRHKHRPVKRGDLGPGKPGGPAVYESRDARKQRRRAEKISKALAARKKEAERNFVGSFLHGMYVGGIEDRIRVLPGMRDPLLSKGQRPTVGKVIKSMAASFGTGALVRAGINFGLHALTGGASMAVSIACGVATGQVMMARHHGMRRRHYNAPGEAEIIEKRSHVFGRMVGTAVFSGLMAAAGVYVADATHAAEHASHALSSAKDWVDNKVGTVIDEITGGSKPPLHTPDSAPTAPGTPPDGVSAPPSGEPHLPDKIQTDQLGSYSKGFDPDTDYHSGTGYNAIAHTVMDQYHTTTGQELDWESLRKTPGFESAYNKFVGHVLKDNDLTWEDARHMPSDARLTIHPDTEASFIKDLHRLTGGKYDLNKFSAHNGGTLTAAEAPLIGQDDISHAGAITNDFNNNYLPSHPYDPSMSPDQYVARYWDDLAVRDPAAFKYYSSGMGAPARRALTAELVYGSVMGHAGFFPEDIASSLKVADVFHQYTLSHPYDPTMHVGEYVGEFLRDGAPRQLYSGMSSAMQAALFHQLMQHIENSSKLAQAASA